MEARYQVVVDVGDGSVIVIHAKSVRVERELADGGSRFEFSTWEPDRHSTTGSEHVEERTR